MCTVRGGLEGETGGGVPARGYGIVTGTGCISQGRQWSGGWKGEDGFGSKSWNQGFDDGLESRRDGVKREKQKEPPSGQLCKLQ